VFALRFPQEFSIKNDIDPFKRDFYGGTNVPQIAVQMYRSVPQSLLSVLTHFQRLFPTLFIVFESL
jgi:hypothetical protein